VHDHECDHGAPKEMPAGGITGQHHLAQDVCRLAAALRRIDVDAGSPSEIVCYEFERDHVVISSPVAFSASGALSEGDTSARIRLSNEAMRALSTPTLASDHPACVVSLDGEGPRRVLIDLASAGVSAVVGAETAIDDTLHELAKQAANSAFSTVGRVIVVGRELRGLSEESPAIPVNRVEESLEVLRRLEASGRIGDGSHVSLVVVGRDAYRGQAVRGLLAYASRRPWCCVLLPFPAAAARVIVSAIGGELACYFRVAGAGAETDGFADGLEGSGIGLDPPVEVAVLGQIEVRGASGSLDRRPKLTELIVYLAMHPEGASTATWQNALWPDRRVPAQTVANRLSEARRLLGMELDGMPRLRRSAERHRLAGVITDWERFCVLADARRDHVSWRQALELVRGRPFDDLQQGEWTVFEGFCSEIETAIIDCALRYGENRLVAGDPDAVAWASQRALRANPYDERLHRLLMRAADAAGNRSGVETVYRNLVLLMDIDGDGESGIHPETTELYERLSGRRNGIVRSRL
jgi:DNA-binding SARP family transcriptional activator